MAKLVKAGTPFSLTKSSARGGKMPKRGTPLNLVVNGNPVDAVVTSNAAWCGDPSLTIEYIWIEWEGRAVYVTLAYGEKAASWAGEEVSVEVGAGPKPNPRLVDGSYKSVTESLAREAGRIDAFKNTWAKRVA